MNTEQAPDERLEIDLLRSAFATPPPADDSLARMRAKALRSMQAPPPPWYRRARQRGRSVSRPLAVAAGVAVLSLAAVTVVGLTRPADDNAPPAGEDRSSGSAGADPAIADLSMPFSLEWLPPGEVEYQARRLKEDGRDKPEYSGEYMLTVTAGGQVLNIDVQQRPMLSADEATVRSGPGNPVTIGGQRGIESSHSDGPGGYELYVARPEGGSMYLNVSVEYGSTVPPQQLIDNGRRIAENIRVPGTTTVTPSFGLRDLPDGMRICTFDVEKPLSPSPLGSKSSTSYALGTCATRPRIRVNTANANGPTGVPGEPVQGHQTRVVDENGYLILWLLDAVNDAPIRVAGSVPLTDLYDIANRLVLPR